MMFSDVLDLANIVFSFTYFLSIVSHRDLSSNFIVFAIEIIDFNFQMRDAFNFTFSLIYEKLVY